MSIFSYLNPADLAGWDDYNPEDYQYARNWVYQYPDVSDVMLTTGAKAIILRACKRALSDLKVWKSRIKYDLQKAPSMPKVVDESAPGIIAKIILSTQSWAQMVHYMRIGIDKNEDQIIYAIYKDVEPYIKKIMSQLSS